MRSAIRPSRFTHSNKYHEGWQDGTVGTALAAGVVRKALTPTGDGIPLAPVFPAGWSNTS